MSVVIPVKDGERYLEELLAALAREGVDEVLVIDSGSRDRSLEIVRAAGVELLEIDPAEFGHGRTRNLGAERTSGELICFLTQDATPVPGWAAAYREAFALDERVGAAYGPHLPRPDTSPMIARELTEFFAGSSRRPTMTVAGGAITTGSANGAGHENGASASSAHGPVLQRAGDPTFLSNVNACYARACWEEIRFREIAYSEDQAFGSDLLAAGWVKVYQPGAAVLHAHDYGALEFMRRYFDEYRGLHESTGHVEPFGVLATARQVRAAVAGDRRWGPRRASRRRAGAAGRRARPCTTAGGACSRRSARAPSGCPRPCAGACRSRAATTAHRSRRRRRVRLRAGPLAGLARGPRARRRRRASRRSRRPRTCRPSATTTTTRMSRASGARAPRRCSTPCRGWPSASACAWRS